MNENKSVFNIDEFLKNYSLCLTMEETIFFINNSNSKDEIFVELDLLQKLINKKEAF